MSAEPVKYMAGYVIRKAANGYIVSLQGDDDPAHFRVFRSWAQVAGYLKRQLEPVA